MDSCLVFEREAGNVGTEIYGLDHLVGQTVRIMADGAQKEDQIVNSEGKIAIGKNDNRVVVGLPVKSVFKAKKRYIQSQGSFGVGDVQQIDHLCLMLYRSGGGKVGGKFKDLVDILYRNTNAKMGSSYKLFTGNKIITWPNGVSNIEDRGADIIVYNDSVYPMTVLAVSPQMTSNGD